MKITDLILSKGNELVCKTGRADIGFPLDTDLDDDFLPTSDIIAINLLPNHETAFKYFKSGDIIDCSFKLKGNNFTGQVLITQITINSGKNLDEKNSMTFMPIEPYSKSKLQ